MKISENIFRAYDIRGVFGRDLTIEIAEQIGKGFGSFIGSGKELMLGRDVRLSGEVLSKAIAKGLTSVGCNVIDIGIVPTPVLYFAVANKNKAGGVMITASHNPPEWNGFKFSKEKGMICGKGLEMEKIKEIVLKQRFNKPKTEGIIEKYELILDEYCEFVLNKTDVEKKLRVVLDTGNGACGIITPKLFRKIGCEVIAINERLDGNFPSHLPEPNEETLRQLKEEVIKTKADFGVGYDGDGDRGVFVDDKGRIVRGDIVLIVFAKYLLEKQKNMKIVFEVSCSSIVEEFIKANGGIAIVERVGRSYIMDRVIKEKAIIGGEVSSHFYFPEIYGIDDATFASLKMVEILSKSSLKLSQIIDSIPKYHSSPIKKYVCKDKHKFTVIEELKSMFSKLGFNILDIDGVKAYKDNGWILIRASNTEPVIKMNAEANTKDKLEELFDLGKKIINEVLKKYD